MTTVAVYVPTPDAEDVRDIAPGSGIVGTAEGDLVTIDYEGGLYGAAGHRTWTGRIATAAGRHVARYPTRARKTVWADQVRQVGQYELETGALNITDDPALTAWIEGGG